MKQFISSLLYVSLLLLPFFSSSQDNGSTRTALKIQVLPSDINDSLAKQSLMSSVELIPLEATPSSTIREVHKIIQHNDEYILLDKFISSSVLAFDSRGKFLHSYGAKGNGPGEYILPMDFTIDKDQNELMIINSERHFLNFYDLENGSFKRALPYSYPVREVYKLSDDLFAFAGSSTDDRIIFADNKLSRQKSFLDYQTRFGISLTNNLVQLNDSLLTFRLSFNDTIYAVGPRGIEPYLIFDFGDKSLSDAFYNQLSIAQQMKLGEYVWDRMGNIHVFQENDQTRIFSFGYNKGIYFCVQDKLSGNKKIFRKDLFYDEKFPIGIMPSVLGVDQSGFFLAVVSSEKFLHAKEAIMSAGVFSLEEFDKITSMSNPILVKFKFKRF